MAAKQASAFEKGKLYNLPIPDIKPDPDQPRRYMDPQALEELAASIKQLGLLQPGGRAEKEQKTGSIFVNRLIISMN
jgi:hypothetical protein